MSTSRPSAAAAAWPGHGRSSQLRASPWSAWWRRAAGRPIARREDGGAPTARSLVGVGGPRATGPGDAGPSRCADEVVVRPSPWPSVGPRRRPVTPTWRSRGAVRDGGGHRGPDALSAAATWSPTSTRASGAFVTWATPTSTAFSCWPMPCGTSVRRCRSRRPRHHGLPDPAAAGTTVVDGTEHLVLIPAHAMRPRP
jgi:hypothetical protein